MTGVTLAALLFGSSTVYRLLISQDSGPRLPLLLMFLGFDRAGELLNVS